MVAFCQSNGPLLETRVLNSTSTRAEGPWNLFFYNGKFQKVPEGFKLPKGGPLVAWQMWCCGDPVKKIRPLSFVEPKELHSRNLAKRLSDLALLSKTIEKICVVREGFASRRKDITIQEANDWFYHALPHLPAQEKRSQAGNERRPKQVTWNTMVRHIQKTRHLAAYSDIFPLNEEAA